MCILLFRWVSGMPNLLAFNLSEQSLSAGRFSCKAWNYVIIILMQFFVAHVTWLMSQSSIHYLSGFV